MRLKNTIKKIIFLLKDLYIISKWVVYNVKLIRWLILITYYNLRTNHVEIIINVKQKIKMCN